MPNDSGNKRQTNGSGRLSFLGARPRIPPLPDSHEPSDLSKPVEHQSVAEIPFGIKDPIVNDVEQDPILPRVNSGPTFSPTLNSPTAVPFANRRHPPLLSSKSRSRPPMPFSTKTRPRSTEFRSSEFRPLYLVARHTPRHEPSIENYYSLPSSHSTTRTSSIQDPEEFDLERGPSQIDALDLVDPTMIPHSEGRGLVIDTQHSLQGLDLLDSAQSTPTAHSFQAAGQRDASPQAKTMQDLESALVAMPLLLSPSFANLNHDPSSASQYRSQELIHDRNNFSSDHGWKKNFPGYPFELTEDLPPLPSSRTSSPESVSEPNSLETIIQPIIHLKHEFELSDDLPPLPSSRASSPDLDILDGSNITPESSLRSTENDFEPPRDFVDLSSIHPLSPDPCIEPTEQRFLSLSKHEVFIPENLLSLPSSRVSSPELGDESEKLKRDVRTPGDLPPLPRSTTPTPNIDAQLGQSISMPQLIREFESPRNLPALPSSCALSPDNDIKSAPEPETITRPAYTFQALEGLPALPGSSASSPDLDARLGDRVLVCQPVDEFGHFEHRSALPSSRASSPVANAKSNLGIERKISLQPGYGLEQSAHLPPLPPNRASSPDIDPDLNAEPTIYPQSRLEFQRSEDLPALPSSRASSPDADAKSNLELERKTSQPVYGLEPSEHLPPLPSSRASSPDFDTDFNVEPIISPQYKFEFQRSDDLPALPSSRDSSPDADIFHDVETKIPLKLTLEFPSSEDLPALPSSRASSPDADIYHEMKTEIHLEPTVESHGSEYLPALPVSHASSLETYSTPDIKTKIPLEPTSKFHWSENPIKLPSRCTSSPHSDSYHDVQSSSPNSSNKTEEINNKSGSKVMTQEKNITNLGGGLDSDEITGVINAEITESSQALIERTLQSPDLLTSKENSLDDAKESEHSLQWQPDVENADTLSTPEKAVDIEPTVLPQESLSSGNLTKGMTGDEVVAVMAAVAEGGTNTHDKRPMANSKKARRNQKKAKQEDRPQAKISEASDRASVQQEGMENDLSSQSFEPKDPNMPSSESLVATDLSIKIIGTQLSPGENIQIEENPLPVKKGKKGKKNKKQAVETGPSLKSVVVDDSPTKASSQAARAAVLGSTAGEFDMEGAKLGGPSVETADQKSLKAASLPESPPEAVALPIDDDFELLEAPPVRPIDRFSLPYSFSKSTALPADDHQKTVLDAERPPEAVQLRSDTDLDLLAPTQYLETTVGGRYQSKEPENNEAHEPFAMVAKLHKSASGSVIVPVLPELRACDDLDQVEASPQNALFKKADETSQEQVQLEYSQSEILNSLITESLRPDLGPNLAAQFIALPPNADLDLLEASPLNPLTELTHTGWLEQLEPPINEPLGSVPAHEITPRAGPLPDSEDLGLQKSSSRSLSVEPTEQRSQRPELSEFKHPEESGSSTQLLKDASVLAPEFTALPSDTHPGLLGYLPRMMSVEVPGLNTQLDESKGDVDASSPKSPETPIVPAEDTTTIADSDLEFLDGDLPSQPKESVGHPSPAGEPIAELPKDVYDIQSDPETIALPADDDLDLLDALPPSPLTDSQPESIDEPSLRSSTELLRPSITPEIFVLPAVKDFRSLRAPLTSSFDGPLPTIPEEVLEQEVAPENVKLPSDDDFELVEELPVSPLADLMDSQLEAPEETKFHPSRELNEPEVTSRIIADEELDLPDALSNLDTIELPNDEDLDLLETLPPSLDSDTRQVSQAGSITLPETLSPSPPAEHISRSPKVLLERNVNPEISDIPAVEDFDSRRAMPPSSPVHSPLNPVNEQIFKLPENFLTSTVTPEVIALPADKDFDLLEALPPSTWAGSQHSSGKEVSSTSLTNIPEAMDVTQGIRADHDLAKALPPSAFHERMEYQADQHEEFSPRPLKEPEVTPQAVELPYDDDLDLLEALPPSPPASPTPELESRVRLPPSPSTGSKENHIEQLGEGITKGLEAERVSPKGPLSRSVKSEDDPKPAKELASTSLVLEVNSEATKLPVGDNLDSLNTLPPSLSTKLTEYQARSLEETIPTSLEVAPSIFACADTNPGLLESPPEKIPADQTQSIEESIIKPSGRKPGTVACADGDPSLEESCPEILSPDHQTGSLKDPALELLELAELAPSTVACADGDLGVPGARPEILSIDQSSQQTDLLDERISKWQNELMAESQLPSESIQLPADEDRDILADLPPSSTKSIISYGLELRPLEQAPQPEKTSRHALDPLKEMYSQVLPKHLPLPADDGLESLKALPESPLPESQVVSEYFPPPKDDVTDLSEELPESLLSESRVNPQDFPLPTDDDSDFLEALPESQVAPKDFLLPTDDDLDLLEELPKSPLSESPVVPEDSPLPTETLPKSHLPESQVAPKDFPLPTDDDLDLLEWLPESPLTESLVVPENFPLPTDNELEFLEALPKSPLPKSQVAPRDFSLLTDDGLDLINALPESPLLESSNKDSDGLETQHLRAKEQDPDSHHNPVIADFLKLEVAPEIFQLPANDDLDLETSPQSFLVRSINPANKDIAPLETEGLLKENVKREVAEEFEGTPGNANGDTDKVSEDVGKDARSVAEYNTDGTFFEKTEIFQDDGVHTGSSVGKNAKKKNNNKKDKKSTSHPTFAPQDLQTKPMWVASESRFIEDIASEPKVDTPATELEEGKDGVFRQFGAQADEDLGSGKNKGKKGKKSKSRATTMSVRASIPTTSLPLELPTKSAGGAVFEVPMQEKTKEVTSEEPELLDNDGDISKEGKKKTKKGEKNQEVSSKSGLILEEVELPKASVATPLFEGSNETTISSENLVRTTEVEGSQGQQKIEDEWLNEPKKRCKRGKKAADSFPPPGGPTEIIEPPLSKTMEGGLDFEDSQAQAMTEDKRQKEPKKKGKKGGKSKDKKSKPSITSPSLPLMTSPAYPIDDSSSTDVAQIKAFELSLDQLADTKDETSSDGKIDEADMKQISSFENTETAELQPESEEIVSEVALQDPHVENELPGGIKKKARKKKGKSKISDNYREGSDSEKVESSYALSEPMPELVEQLVETCDKEAVEEPRQDQGLTETMGLELEHVEPGQGISGEALPEATIDDEPAESVRKGDKGKKRTKSIRSSDDDTTTSAELTRKQLELTQTMPALESEMPIPEGVRPKEDDGLHISAQQIGPRSITPDLSFTKSLESEQVEPGRLESRFADLEEPWPAQSHSVNIEPNQTESNFRSVESLQTNASEPKDLTSGQPKSQLVEGNPTESSLKLKPEHIEKDNFTFNTAYSAQDVRKSTPTPQEPDSPESVPGDVAAPVENVRRKNPSSIVDPELPVDLQVVEHSPTREKSLAISSRQPPTSDAENNLLGTQEYLSLISEPDTLTQLPPSTDQHPLVLEISPFPATESSFAQISDKSLALPEEPVVIKLPLSGKSFVAAEEVPVIEVPSDDELPATAEELAAVESHKSPHHAKEPFVKDLDVSPADISVVGIEGPCVRDVASRNKHPLAVEDPSAMEVPSSDTALVALEEPAITDRPSSNESLVHVEELSVTESGPPEKSAIPVQEPSVIEAPMSAKSSPTTEGHSIVTMEELSVFNELSSVAQELLSHTETSSLGPMELISEENTHNHPYTAKELTPTSVRDIESSAVIDIAAKPYEDDLLNNADQVPEDIFPHDDFVSAKKIKGKESKKTVTTEQGLTVSDGSSAAIKQKIESQKPDENSLMLENIIAVPQTNKSKAKMVLEGMSQEDELDLPDHVPIASEDILELTLEAELDQFGDDVILSAVPEKQDDRSVPLEEHPIAPIERSKKVKKDSKARKQANDDLARPEGGPIAPVYPSAILGKQDDKLNQPDDDAITPEGLPAVYEKQREIDEPIGPGKNTKKGKKGSKSRKQGVFDELDQPEVVPISPKSPLTGPERQEVELDGIEEDPNITKDLAGICGKQVELDESTAPLKNSKKFKGSKKGRNREVDKIDQPEYSSAVLDELQSEKNPITPDDFHAVFEKQGDALQSKEDPTIPEDLSTVSKKQDELKTNGDTIMPEEYLPGLETQKERLRIKKDTITPENFLASPKTQQQGLLAITPGDLSVSPEAQELDQNFIASVGVPPGDLSTVSKKQKFGGDEDVIAQDTATPEDLSFAPEKQKREPEKLDEERTEKAKKGKKSKKGSKARKREVDELEQQEDISAISEKQDQVDGSIGPNLVTPDSPSALFAIQDRLEETLIAIDPVTPEGLSSTVPESQVDEPEQLEDDTIAPNHSYAVKKAKKGKKGKKQEIFTELDQPEEVLITSEVRSAALEKHEAEHDQFGKKTKKSKKVKSKRQRLDDLREEGPLDHDDFSATDLKKTDQLDQPEGYPVVSGDLSAIHTKQIGSLNQPEEDQVISQDFSAIDTKQINLLHQLEGSVAPENSSALTVDKLDQTQEHPITSEELSALTAKLDQSEQESIHPEELSAALSTTAIDENIHDPASSENFATSSKNNESQKGKKGKMQGADKLDQLMEQAATEDKETTLLRQEDELGQPKQPIAPKEIGTAISKQQDQFEQPEQESILSESITSVITIEKGKKARRQDKRGIEETEEEFIASEHSATVIEAFHPEDPTTTEKNDAGAIQLESDAFDEVDEEPVAVKSPVVPEKKKGKKPRQDNTESTEHVPLEDDELDQPGQGDIASADTVAEINAKKGKNGTREKHVERLGQPDQTIRAPEAASASQDMLLDRPEQSIIASVESSAPQGQSAEIPWKKKSKKSKKPKQYENSDQSDNRPITPPENVASLEIISDIPTSKQVGQDDESIQRSLNVPGLEPSVEASASQEDFPEIAVAKSKTDRKNKKESQTNAPPISEEIIATTADAGVPKLLPDDTRDLTLESISQQLSDNVSKPQDEPQHEGTKEPETGQKISDVTPDLTVPIIEYPRTETPVAEESRMNNSLGIQAEEAILHDRLVKPQAEREFEDAGIRGEDNSLLIEGYREATQGGPSHGHPGDQREDVAVQALQATAALDSMLSDVTVQLQNKLPLAVSADRDVEHTYPAKFLNSYDANPFADLEKGDERRQITENSQTVHPSDGDIRPSTPSLEANPAEPRDKGLVEVERPKSSGLTIMLSDIVLNRHTYSEGLTEPEKNIPGLPLIGPAFKKSTPVEELSAPEWGLKPAKNGREKKSKKKALRSEILNIKETLERGTADVSEGATLAGDLNLKLTKEIEEALPEISLTGATIEKFNPVEELDLPEWGLKPAKKGKNEKKSKKSKKKALDGDPLNTDEIFERDSADASEGATLTGDLGLELAEEFGEDLPRISLTKADVEKFIPVEEPSDPERELLSTREILEERPANFSEEAALDRHMDSKPIEGFTMPELDVPELPLANTDAAEELSVSEARPKPAKKSKKEKKSNKKAWDTDFMTTGEILAREPGDIPEDLARDSDFKPSELARPENRPELRQIDNNAEESIPVEDSAITELRHRPSKKDKKDKKSKSGVMASVLLATKESIDPAASKTPATGAPTEHNLPVLLITEESIPNDDSTKTESGFGQPKKIKKDKKSKERAIAGGSLVPEATELPTKSPKEHIFHETSNADKSISIEDSTLPKSRSLTLERSKKDKKSKKKHTVNNLLVTQETPEPTPSGMTTEIPEEQIVPQFLSTKKSRKSKETRKQNLGIDYGTPLTVGDNIERGPAETPLDVPAEPTIPEHEPSTKRTESKQSKEQDFELGSNIPLLDTEPVPENGQQAAEASRSASSADHVDKDRNHHETERQQTLTPERKLVQDETEQTYNPPPVHTHDEIGADNTNVKIVGFKSETPTPGGSSPGESTPGESTPAESITRGGMAPLSGDSHVSGILPVQHDIQDNGSQGTEASALEKQYPDFIQAESQPHFEVEKHSSGREFEAQELSRNPSGSATENTFNISVEVDPSYGVSISTPSSKRKRSLTVSAPARNDEEVFPNNTRVIESLHTEGQPFQDPGEPSSVSHTTKEMSSALFQSSPSTREDFVNRRLEPERPLHDPAEIKDVEYGSRDLPDWIQPADFSINKSRTTTLPRIDLKTSIRDGKRGPSGSESPVSPVSPVSPAGFREERTPSRSPFVSDISDRPRLNTIVEYSPDESPLHKSRSVSDVGSPEQGAKFRHRSAVPQQSSQVRMRSPLNPENTARLTAPFEELTYRLSWPPVDEDHHTVDLERSGSRNTSVSKQSERRSPSGASVGSVESINAIIKTPDVKSSVTPPLRRTDRSVSGDLREAHKKGGAKKLARRKEAEDQFDIAIPSSSTYDPTKDKGKSRVDDMAAVYVSNTFDFTSSIKIIEN